MESATPAAFDRLIEQRDWVRRLAREDGGALPERGRVTVRPAGAGERDHGEQMSVSLRADGTFESEPLDPERSWDLVGPFVQGLVAGSALGVKPGAEEVVLLYRKGASLRERVLDGEGRPAAGIWVRAEAAGADGGAQVPGGAAQARTGEDGVFLLEGLGEFHFLLRTSRGDFLPSTSDREWVPGEEAEVRVAPGYAFSGRLVDGAGAAVKGGTIMGTPSGTEGSMGIDVGPDGTFRFRGLPAGRIALWMRVKGKRVDLGTFEVPGEGVEVGVPEGR